MVFRPGQDAGESGMSETQDRLIGGALGVSSGSAVGAVVGTALGVVAAPVVAPLVTLLGATLAGAAIGGALGVTRERWRHGAALDAADEAQGGSLSSEGRSAGPSDTHSSGSGRQSAA